MTVEELIEKLQEFPSHMIVRPTPCVKYVGHSIIILFPKSDAIDYDDYDYSES